MLGIENLKKLIKTGLTFGQKVADDLQDKKISVWEAIGLIPDIFGVIGVVKTWPECKAELDDLTPEETTELENWVMSEFNIPNAKVKDFIQHSIMFVIAGAKLVDEFKHIRDAE